MIYVHVASWPCVSSVLYHKQVWRQPIHILIGVAEAHSSLDLLALPFHNFAGQFSELLADMFKTSGQIHFIKHLEA